jgi:pheromone shutdown protein TraB
VTLQRIWGSLSFWEKMRIAWMFLSSTDMDIKPEDIERMKNSDILAAMMDEVTKEFPTLLTPLLNERDQFLTSSLRICPGTVVGVVGKKKEKKGNSFFFFPFSSFPLFFFVLFFRTGTCRRN